MAFERDDGLDFYVDEGQRFNIRIHLPNGRVLTINLQDSSDYSLEQRTLEGEELDEVQKDRILINKVYPAILPFMQAVITRFAEGKDDREFGMSEAAYLDALGDLYKGIHRARSLKVDEQKVRGLGELVAHRIVTPEPARDTAIEAFNTVVNDIYHPETSENPPLNAPKNSGQDMTRALM